MPYKGYKGANTGTTIRPYVKDRIYQTSKLASISVNSTSDTTELDDKYFSPNVNYSIKKHKQWELINRISSDQFLDELEETYDKVTVQTYKGIPRNAGNTIFYFKYDKSSNKRVRQTADNNSFFSAQAVQGRLEKQLADLKQTVDDKSPSCRKVKCRRQVVKAKSKCSKPNASFCHVIEATPTHRDANENEITITAGLPVETSSYLSAAMCYTSKYKSDMYYIKKYSINRQPRQQFLDDIVNPVDFDEVDEDVLQELTEHYENCSSSNQTNENIYCDNIIPIQHYIVPKLRNDTQKQKRKAKQTKRRCLTPKNTIVSDTVPSENDDDSNEVISGKISQILLIDLAKRSLQSSHHGSIDDFLINMISWHCVKVNPETLDPNNLVTQYQNCYREGQSLPRKFIINVSPDILDCSTPCNTVGVIVFKVVNEFNDYVQCHTALNICLPSERIECIRFQEDKIYTVDEIKCIFLQYCALLPKHLFYPSNNICAVQSLRLVTKICHSNVLKVNASLPFKETVTIDQSEILNLNRDILDNYPSQSNNDSSVNNVELEQNWELVSSLRCPKCLTNLETHNTITLLCCGNSVCSDCWQRAAIFNLQQANLQCIFASCQAAVDSVTLCSMIPLSMYRKCKLSAVTAIMATQWIEKICHHCHALLSLPTSVISQSKSFPFDILCSCDRYTCVSCNNEGHWPAPCEIAKMYRNEISEHAGKLSEHALTSMNNENLDNYSIGKLCPKCSRFHSRPDNVFRGKLIFCYWRCNCRFCWTCLTINKTNADICSSCQSSTYKDIKYHSTVYFKKNDPVPSPRFHFSAKDKIMMQCFATKKDLQPKGILEFSRIMMGYKKFVDKIKNSCEIITVDDEKEPVERIEQCNNERKIIYSLYRQMLQVYEYSLAYSIYLFNVDKAKSENLKQCASILQFCRHSIRDILNSIKHHSADLHKGLDDKLVQLQTHFQTAEKCINTIKLICNYR